MDVDCKVFRYKWLSLSFHKLRMGNGAAVVGTRTKNYQGWEYPTPEVSAEIVPEFVCHKVIRQYL